MFELGKLPEGGGDRQEKDRKKDGSFAEVDRKKEGKEPDWDGKAFYIYF